MNALALLLAVIPAPAEITPGVGTLTRETPPTVTIKAGSGPAEGYTLAIDAKGITIVAADAAGAFYAARTLEQLPRPLPLQTIKDAPRFQWRGLHLDVARHFFPASDLKRLLDLMAQWKLNVFHWHLTDDQGFRLPVAKHPELTSTGPAYTAAEIHDVVAYAAARHITVVPEIDLPGHTRAVLAVHPELSCRKQPLPLPTTYGVFDDVLCIGNPDTYALVGDVIAAAEELFPGPYLHLGGDEVPPTRWRECPRCKSLHQSDFLARVRPLVHKRLIGWDEVLEQGAPKDMIIMAWRDGDPATKALVAGHPVILNPMRLTYLSEPYIRWEQIDAIDPPAGLLGLQAAVWTEDLHTFSELEPILFPRLLAIADVAWGPQKRPPLGPRLAEARRLLAVAYDIEAPHGLDPQHAFIDAGTLTLTAPEMFSDAEIQYALDGGTPSQRYTGPISVTRTTDFTAQLVVGNRRGDIVRGRYVVAPPRPAGACAAPRFTYSEAGKRVRTGALTTLIPRGVRDFDWELAVTGTFKASADGVYRFDLKSDDGSRLFIGDELLIDNGGDHAPRLRSGEIALSAGCHPLKLDFTQHGGAYSLSLDVSRDSEPPLPVFPGR
jgi:hexosaminidase